MRLYIRIHVFFCKLVCLTNVARMKKKLLSNTFDKIVGGRVCENETYHLKKMFVVRFLKLYSLTTNSISLRGHHSSSFNPSSVWPFQSKVLIQLHVNVNAIARTSRISKAAIISLISNFEATNSLLSPNASASSYLPWHMRCCHFLTGISRGSPPLTPSADAGELRI